MYEPKTDERENAVLVGVVHKQQEPWVVEEHMDELELLADTAGADTVARIIQRRTQINPAHYVGRGKVNEIKEIAEECRASLIIFDDDLSPAQARNLEEICKVKVLDRSGVILDIFANRARTKQAKTQVELAQLNYHLPRLTRQWTHLSRQVGGIGTRGPGETQLEVDRRLVRQRIRVLKNQLAKIEKEQSVRRKGRDDVFKVALVGYTNVGKSTLLNSLTDSDVFVEDRLFATLDATVRSLPISELREIVMVDTVGFIRKLPHNLVASFRSTLAESADADVLLIVVDITDPHYEEQINTVRQVLTELKIEDRPQVFVFNKVDRLEEKSIINRVKKDYPGAQIISAANGMFLTQLCHDLQRRAEADIEETTLTMPIHKSGLLGQIYDKIQVLERTYDAENVTLKIRGLNWKINQVKNMIHHAA